MRQPVKSIQRELFAVGSAASTRPSARKKPPEITAAMVESLTDHVRRLESIRLGGFRLGQDHLSGGLRIPWCRWSNPESRSTREHWLKKAGDRPFSGPQLWIASWSGAPALKGGPRRSRAW
jgi:hypothetical protein